MGAPRTSWSDPLRVAWLRSPVFPQRSIGLTFAPGKRDPHALSGTWDRNLGEDLRVLREKWAADVLICLLEDSELTLLGIEELPTRATQEGLRFIRLPIRDGTAPSDSPALREAVALAVSEAEAGSRVVVHCRGGLGRAGTFAAYCLRARGVSPADAIREVRAVRPGAIETTSQERSIRAFEPTS